MSTDRAEMELFASEVNKIEGAEMILHPDEEGRIEYIEVKGLNGFKDQVGSPIIVMEDLRRRIGIEVFSPSVVFENGFNTYAYTYEQCDAFCRTAACMASGLVYSGEIPEGAKYRVTGPGAGGKPKVTYWKAEDRDPVELSKEEFNNHKQPAAVHSEESLSR